jgi:hypothetical protein
MIQTFKEEKRTADDLIINRSVIKDVTIPANIVEAWEAWSIKKAWSQFLLLNVTSN